MQADGEAARAAHDEPSAGDRVSGAVERGEAADAAAVPVPDELLERAHQARLLQAGRLLAGIVHEIKNPLAVIQGYAQLLRARIHDSADREDLERLLAETQRLGTLVEDMLGFVRRGSDGIETVDLNRVVESAVNLSAHALRQARVTVSAELEPSPVLARGQHGVYVQVLLNLIGNARNAMAEARTPHPRLVLRVQRGATDRLQIVVANNGPPIAPDLAEQIFSPFVTTRSGGGGTGLGLSLCREILRRYGGEISLDPPPDGSNTPPGVSFRVDVPRS